MTRWNIVISEETDRQVRSYLARTGGKKVICPVSLTVRYVKLSSGRQPKRSGNETNTSQPKKPKPSPTKLWIASVRIVLDTESELIAQMAQVKAGIAGGL